MLSKEQDAAFGEFLNKTISNGVLDPKTTLLIQIGCAMTAGCSP